MENEQYTVEGLLADESFIAYCNNEPIGRKAWEVKIEQDERLRGLAEEARQLFELIKAELTDVSKATAAFHQLLQHKTERPLRRIAPVTRNWIWAAASLAAIVAAVWFLNSQQAPSSLPDKVIVENMPAVDAAPGRNTAILILGNGSAIVLDSAGNGEITVEGNTRIMKSSDGQIQYEQNDGVADVLYNTMQTPKGGQYRLVLPDGTRVWLNAASSIRYPTSFNEDKRIVEISGEVYFEVASVRHPVTKTGYQPFIVKKDDLEVEVLGTHFNINAYEDEADARVTLLEGSVQVSARSGRIEKEMKSARLKPGDQARMKSSGAVRITNEVNLEEVMAWKNGLFDFNNADISTIMRQITRWYDLEVSYEGKIPQREFSGKITRNTNVSNVLRILEQSGIHFRLEHKKIIVMP